MLVAICEKYLKGYFGLRLVTVNASLFVLLFGT